MGVPPHYSPKFFFPKWLEKHNFIKCNILTRETTQNYSECLEIDFKHNFIQMIDKARGPKNVSNNSLIKFGTKVIRNKKVPQK